MIKIAMNKRGINTIIATVLLILLALVAIFIIWLFLRPTIIGTGGKAADTRDCLRIGVEVEKCEYSLCHGGNIAGSFTALSVKRNAGEGNLTGLAFLVGNDSETKLLYSENATYKGDLPEQRDISLIAYYFSDLVPTNANVAARIGSNKQTCNPLSGPTECKELVNPNLEGCADFNGDGHLSTKDFIDFLDSWSRKTPEGDINQDGNVDHGDFLEFCILMSKEECSQCGYQCS